MADIYLAEDYELSTIAEPNWDKERQERSSWRIRAEAESP